VNKFHVYAIVQAAVLANEAELSDGKSVFHTLREQYPSITDLMSRSEIEKVATSFFEGLKKVTFAVERRAMELQAEEAMLRADLIDELAKLDVTDPGVAREVLATINSTVASAGEPSLQEAIDILKGADVDVVSFEARLEALFPDKPVKAGAA
jgi:hypothetical protein